VVAELVAKQFPQLETEKYVKRIASTLERAGLQMSLEQVGMACGALGIFVFILAFAMLHPAPLLAVVLFIPCLAAGVYLFKFFVDFKTRKRLGDFVTQLELALRLIASGVRIGLGLRQALTVVIEEMPDPARYEFMRIVGQTNIGVSVFDALDDLAARMPGNETLMMARAIRIQSQTGGDLSKILELLANTIKERRRIQRKISALTAEGRMSAGVLSALPPFLGGFICLTQRDMGAALLFTPVGHIALAIVVVLEILGATILFRMLKVDV